jgi:imidazoleglycerol-phosphate dehydratase
MTELNRQTKETSIKCKVDISGKNGYKIDTGIGFFDHMLEALSKHSNIDINLTCKGDLHIDAHHSVEDCGIVLGQALKKEIFPIKNIQRYGDAIVVMDEASTSCAIDLSNRAFLVYQANIFGKVGEFDVELAQEFFQALIANSGITCHLINQRGSNKHHILESVFKAFAVSLKRALQESKNAGIPSTKGIL